MKLNILTQMLMENNKGVEIKRAATESPYLPPGRCNYVAGVLTMACRAQGTKKPPGLSAGRAEAIRRGADFLTEAELNAIAAFTGLEIEVLRSACSAEGCPVFPEDPRRSQVSI